MLKSVKHYLQFSDLDASEYAYLFERAALIKKKFKAYEKHQPLVDRTMAMIFEKASTRTRVSFEAGMYQLGGTVVNLTTEGSQLGRAEPIEDSAKVISRMVDLVMIRTYEQNKIDRFAEHSRVPVINGLTNEFHPCQILADIFTYIEHRAYEHRKHDGSYPIVGVNTFRSPGAGEAPPKLELIRSSEAEKQSQLKRLRAFQEKNSSLSKAMLEHLRQAVINNENVFAVLMDAVRVCSLGQITHALFEVGGQYRRNM